jgi:hypothetical protein
MNEEERWGLLLALDDELLKGGVILSEWCAFLTREADTAFAKGADLASILTAVSAIETYLRSEDPTASKSRLAELIDTSGLESDLVGDLHNLRRYRNKWVHVGDPWNDQALIQNPEQCEGELSKMALLAVKSLKRTIYSAQWS